MSKLAKLKAKVKDKDKVKDKTKVKTKVKSKKTKVKDKVKVNKLTIDWKSIRKEYGQVLTAPELARLISDLLDKELSGKNLRRYLRARYGGTIEEADTKFAVGGRYQFDLKEDEDKSEVKDIIKYFQSKLRKNA